MTNQAEEKRQKSMIKQEDVLEGKGKAVTREARQGRWREGEDAGREEAVEKAVAGKAKKIKREEVWKTKT